MDTKTTKHVINWLEIISATDERRERLNCKIHAVNTGGQTCCGISVDDHWLIGQGRPMMFDSQKAAERFLMMVGIDGNAAEPAHIDIDCTQARQCFHLSDKGALGLCPKHPHRTGVGAANDKLYHDPVAHEI